VTGEDSEIRVFLMPSEGKKGVNDYAFDNIFEIQRRDEIEKAEADALIKRNETQLKELENLYNNYSDHLNNYRYKPQEPKQPIKQNPSHPYPPISGSMDLKQSNHLPSQLPPDPSNPFDNIN